MTKSCGSGRSTRRGFPLVDFQVGCISVAKQVFYNGRDLFVQEIRLKLALPMLRGCVTALEVCEL